jgi:hypothetical protein
MNYSLTITGVIVSIAGTMLVNYGFSEQCSGELTQFLPVLIGGAISWIGRFRAGGITTLGFKE